MTAWMFAVGQLMQQGLALGASVVAARYLGAEEFGVFSIVRNILGIGLVLAPLGLDLALLKILAGSDTDKSPVWPDLRLVRQCSLLFNASIVIGLTLFQCFSANNTPGTDIPVLLIFAALSLPFAADIAILTAMFRARNDVKSQILVCLYFQPILRFILLVSALHLDLGLTGIIFGNSAAYIATSIVLGVVYNRKSQTGIASVISLGSFRGLIALSIPSLVSVLGYMVLRSMDVLMLGVFEHSSLVGSYAAVSLIAQLIQVAPMSLSQTMGPRIARLHSVGDTAGISSEIDRYFSKASIVVAPLVAALAFFGPWLPLLFGPSFYVPLGVSLILSLGYAVSALLGPMGYTMSMTGHHKQELAMLSAGTLTAFLLCWLLIPAFGSLGAASSVAAGFVIINFARFTYIRRVIGITVKFSNLVLPILISAVLAMTLRAVSVYFFPAESLLVAVLTCSCYIVFCIVIYLTVRKMTNRNDHGKSL